MQTSVVSTNSTATFAEWVEIPLVPRNLPGPVVTRTKGILYDGVGAALAATASRYDIGDVLAEITRKLDAGPQAQVFGFPLRTNTVTAALVNGTFGYYIDNESHHPGAIMHAIAVVGPAALAVGERLQSGGRDVITALVAGIDAACRVSYALDGTLLYARGFHPTCVAGTFGSTVAAAKLLDLRGERLLSALGLAGTQASGLLAWVDDDHEHARPFNMGLASRNGVYAAELAASGLSGTPAVFEGKYPLGAAFTGQWRGDQLLDRLGERFMVMELYFKLYACCAFIHPGLDGLLGILEQNNLLADDIAAITFRFPKLGYRVIDANPLRSHCAQYVLALAANRGSVDFYNILNDQRNDSKIRDLEQRVTVIGDAVLDHDYPDHYRTVVELRTKSGQTYGSDVTFPKGSPQNPLSASELDRKVERLTAGLLSGEHLQRIKGMIDDLEGVANIGDLCRSFVTDERGS